MSKERRRVLEAYPSILISYSEFGRRHRETLTLSDNIDSFVGLEISQGEESAKAFGKRYASALIEQGRLEFGILRWSRGELLRGLAKLCSGGGVERIDRSWHVLVMSYLVCYAVCAEWLEVVRKTSLKIFATQFLLVEISDSAHAVVGLARIRSISANLA